MNNFINLIALKRWCFIVNKVTTVNLGVREGLLSQTNYCKGEIRRVGFKRPIKGHREIFKHMVAIVRILEVKLSRF